MKKINKDVVQTAADKLTQSKQLVEEIKRKLKIIEPPKDVERLKDKRQAFMAGQMNTAMRFYDLEELLTHALSQAREQAIEEFAYYLEESCELREKEFFV